MSSSVIKFLDVPVVILDSEEVKYQGTAFAQAVEGTNNVQLLLPTSVATELVEDSMFGLGKEVKISIIGVEQGEFILETVRNMGNLSLCSFQHVGKVGFFAMLLGRGRKKSKSNTLTEVKPKYPRSLKEEMESNVDLAEPHLPGTMRDRLRHA